MALLPYQVTLVAKQDSPFNVLPNTDISIRRVSDNGLVLIYSDEAGTSPISQPGAKTDSNGVFSFFADGSSEILKAAWSDGVTIYEERFYLGDHSKLANINPEDGSAHNASDILDTDLGGQPLQTSITQIKLTRVRFNTLNSLISGIDQNGFTVDLAALSSSKAVVETNFNNIHASNTSPGGGARYQILTSADYGGTPDGSLLNGVYIGGDHYVGGGADYVAKLIGNSSGELDLEMFGAYQNQPVADSTTATNSAFDYAAGRTVYAPHKRIRYEGTWVGNSLSVCGRKRPYWTSDYGSLSGGSIFVGWCLWRPNYAYVADIGFDHGIDSFPSAAADALKISATSAANGKVAIVKGCIGLGRQASDTTHAILVEGYQHYEITDVVGIRNWFALAAKGAGGTIDGVKAIDNGLYAVIVKRDSTYNTTNDNNISNIECIGTPSVTGVGLEIEVVDSQQMQRLNVVNVNARNCGTPVRVNCASGVINDLNMSNIIGQNTTDDAFIITGTVFNAQLSNINMIACGERALNITGGRHFKVSNFTATAKGGNTKFNTDFVLVSATTSKTKMANLSLLQVGYETTGFGVINYANSAGQNEILQYDATLTGTGVPA